MKKCLTVSLLCLSLNSNWVQAAVPSIRGEIESDIRHHSFKKSFNPLLSYWQSRYGTRAVPELLNVAKNPSTADPERYVAIMGVAKIGGPEVASLLCPFLKDRSWMIRNAALRALSALKNPKTSSAIIPLVRDPALVVRLEAVQSLEKLHPEGSVKALLGAIRDPENYHGGRAQWVPEKSLEVLRHLKSTNSLNASETREVASNLTALLDGPSGELKDRSLIPQIEATLRALHY